MLSSEQRVKIRHWFYAEHWKVGTIAQELGLHPDTVRHGQVDWAHFGEVPVGRARRRLSCFLITLSYSRALYLEFFFDQSMENFLRGHVHAFHAWSGQPRILLYDNLRSAVLERRGDQIHFHPRLLDLCSHYHFAPRPCQVRAANQKAYVSYCTSSCQCNVESRLPGPSASAAFENRTFFQRFI
ncbi:MAG TPA: hypothetical protein VIX91_25435 [Candidatus Acidoferrum sp.]